MTKALLWLRFRALFSSFIRKNTVKKKNSLGTAVLFAILYVYLAAVLLGMSGFLFLSLAEPYHELGLDWLYFAMAGIMSLGFGIFGSVFSTQSQLYDAKDNELLLSMPIPPRSILFSRTVPLLALNLVYSGIIFVPAMAVYAVVISFSPIRFLAQIVGLIAICFLAMAISSALGWLLHLSLSRINKSLASMLYMVIFLAVYFTVYSRANEILASFVTNAGAIADSLHSAVWPIYAFGTGCIGDGWMLLLFVLMTAVLFGAVYAVLSATFLTTATSKSSGRKSRALQLGGSAAASPERAIIRKELRRFISCPVYLTNMGFGLIIALALPAAALIFRGTLLELLGQMPFLSPYVPLLICVAESSVISMSCISNPSVSLEGKSLWILKSLPVSPSRILLAKLGVHCLLLVPVVVLGSTIVCIAFSCGFWESVLCIALCAALAVLCGAFGLICGLQWAKLDWISEAYPCKQSLGLAVTMFSMMGIPLVLGLVYGFSLSPILTPAMFLLVCLILISALCFLCCRVIVTWGAAKWTELN